MGKNYKCAVLLVISVVFLAISVTRSVNAKNGKIIIDTDAGVDDAIAIFLAIEAEAKLADDDLEILAITCTYGNAYVENVEQNVLKTLTIANRSDIPVYGGAKKPLVEHYTPTKYFGDDGFGDVNFTEEITGRIDRSKHASVALIDLVKQYPGEVSLLSLGPLTNSAIAIALEPSFSNYLKKHVILGSSVRGVGNIRPGVEYNFGQDPESNYIVLNSTTTTPTVLLPWETVVDSSISKDWRQNVLGKKDSRIVKFLNEIEKVSFEKSSSWNMGDPMAAAKLIWPELITKSSLMNVSPITDGAGRGSVLVDYNNDTGKVKNANIVEKFNVTAYQDLLLEYLS